MNFLTIRMENFTIHSRILTSEIFVRQLSVRSVVCLDLKHMSEITRRNWIKSY